ncbi:nicotinate phosphoribosyltransferase [Desulfuromonas versatilis]|uniref:Nicotinate phosphoribosyltransferase n=1 Tax=Desulfuromonas versatilis TaxID=2802975 RepID=A0ABN6DWR0_9BACT|nr:nicotinate phosphoribosyltransferase [Desulfuromonas versatilis]BCR04568.1 nicotinate phosphoribosyltransferase [Desulfuromonas versatilis]
MNYPALMTDLYELTMLAGYFDEGMHEQPAVFDLFFREAPYRGSYAVFAGLQPALEYLENLRFTADELAYLKSLGLFKPAFLDYLKGFRFRGKLTAPPEGTVVFGQDPLLTVEGTLAEAQYVETALLNIVNFQTLVATKAARLSVAAGDGTVIEFGLRRAQGPDGGLSVGRAAFIGGVRSTSNLWAGQTYGIPVRGTHAHSWVMAFPDELSAFRAYAECFPDSCVLLVDTYDTLNSGIPNAITVARELKDQGHDMLGIRLDSGDLAYLSKEARRLFDEAGFPGVKIVASNELDEHVISSIRSEGGRIDIYGVGTRLATCSGEGGGALGGVYKLVRLADQPKLKVTSDIAKSTVPDRKKLLRVIDPEGTFLMDIMCRAEETVHPGDLVYDPTNPARHKTVPAGVRLEEIRRTVMEQGRILHPAPSLEEMADRCAEQLKRLPNGSLRLVNPHRYKVSISPQLHDLREALITAYEKRQPGAV